MASAYVVRRKRQSGVFFHVRFRLGGRYTPVFHAGAFATLKEARARRDFVGGELAARRDPRIALAQLGNLQPAKRLRQWGQAFVASRVDVEDGTAGNYRNHLRRINATLGDRDPTAITPADVRAWIAAQLEGDEALSPSSMSRYIGTLRQVLDFAGVEPNPARHRTVKLPRAKREEPTPPTRAEVEAIVAAVAPPYRLPIRLMEATALRVGEVLALRWGDVDSRNGRLRVSRARTKQGTGGQRFVRVPAPLLAELEALVPREDRTPDRPVFFIGAEALRMAMQRACTAAGIPTTRRTRYAIAA